MAKTSLQTGGNITSDMAKLAVPLGLILSREGLDRLMSRRSKRASTSAPPDAKPKSSARPRLATAPRLASLSGGSAVKKVVSPKRMSRPTPAATKTKAKANGSDKAAAAHREKDKDKEATKSRSPAKKAKGSSGSHHVAKKLASPVAIRVAPRPSTTARNAKIRQHFQDIAKKVQEIFARARANKTAPARRRT